MVGMDDDRHPPSAPSAVCPFVALEDDRDRRLAQPDRRHRCFAELRPAPRAIAHQQAYCLSTAFPACPTFQDWARREAARPAEGESVAALPPPQPRPRDWAEPPPWGSAADGVAGAAVGAAAGLAPASLARAADRDRHGVSEEPPNGSVQGESDEEAAAAGESDGSVEAPPFLAARARPPAPEAAAPRLGQPRRQPTPDEGFWGGAPDPDRPWEQSQDDDVAWPPAGSFAVGAASASGAARRRPPADPPGGQVRRAQEERGPAWERPRRIEAYPSLRTRIRLPRVRGLWLGVLALILAALVLLLGPTLLLPRGDHGGTPSSTPRPSAPAAASVAPTPTPAPTPQVYVVKEGDTLSKIAAAFGVTIDQIMTANPGMKDPNKIAIGDQLVIPTPAPSVIQNAPSVIQNASPSTAP